MLENAIRTFDVASFSSRCFCRSDSIESGSDLLIVGWAEVAESDSVSSYPQMSLKEEGTDTATDACSCDPPIPSSARAVAAPNKRVRSISLSDYHGVDEI